jgi:hypothetical protein
MAAARIRDGAVVFDDLLTLLNHEFVLAIRTQQLNIGVPEILVMHVEALIALRAAWIEVFHHLTWSSR